MGAEYNNSETGKSDTYTLKSESTDSIHFNYNKADHKSLSEISLDCLTLLNGKDVKEAY